MSQAIYEEASSVDYDVGTVVDKTYQTESGTAIDYDIGVKVPKNYQYDEAYTA